MNTDSRRIALCAATVFVGSALLLALEIVAAGLIAPHVGVSLHTWSAMIGVVLAGLSSGNAIGGAWADRHATADAAGGVLIGIVTTLALSHSNRPGHIVGMMHAVGRMAASSVPSPRPDD